MWRVSLHTEEPHLADRTWQPSKPTILHGGVIFRGWWLQLFSLDMFLEPEKR